MPSPSRADVEAAIARHQPVENPSSKYAPPGLTIGPICNVCRGAWPCEVGVLAAELGAQSLAVDRALRYLVDSDGVPRTQITNPNDIGHAVVILRDIAHPEEGRRWWDRIKRDQERRQEKVVALTDELAAAHDVIARFRAVVNLVYPDDMTPAGKRAFDSIDEPA